LKVTRTRPHSFGGLALAEIELDIGLRRGIATTQAMISQ